MEHKTLRLSILICLFSLALTSCGKEKEPVKVTSLPDESLPQVTDTVGLLPSEEPATISDSTTTFQYAARFPRTGEPVVDSLIEQFVRMQVDSFIAMVPESLISPNWRSELDINYSSSLFPPSFVSYKFDSYQFTGGAHGMTTVTTLNFDLSKKKLLQLSDLFARKAAVAESLSVISRSELRDILGDMLNEEMLENGTSKNLANFSRFMLAPRDLVIFFEPYAVAPYAAGVQVVSIPLTRLGTLLKPEFRPRPEPSADSLSSHG